MSDPKHSLLQTYISEIPDPPKNVKATSIGGRTIELSWEASFSGNLSDNCTQFQCRHGNKLLDGVLECLGHPSSVDYGGHSVDNLGGRLHLCQIQNTTSSMASSQLIRSNSNNSFACTQSDTLTRSNQHIDKRGMCESPSPYATFQLASKVLENLTHHGALPPPPPPRRLENFSNEGSLDLNNRFIAQNMSRNMMMMPGQSNMETTFMFPDMNVIQAGSSSNNFPIKYPNEALKMGLN